MRLRTLPKVGLPLTVALVACAAFGGSVQAQTINPDNTTIWGISSDPTLDYEGTMVTCAWGTLEGTTGTDSDIVNVELDFSGCEIQGQPATSSCSTAWGFPDEFGTAMLRATNATFNWGVVDELNPDFLCTFTIPNICTIAIGEQGLPSDVFGAPGRQDAHLLWEGAPPQELDFGVDLEVDRVGYSLCGPSQGDGAFTARYQLDTNVSFD